MHRKVFFDEVQLEITIVCYEIDHRPIPRFILLGSIDYIPNSELHVTPPKQHVRSRASQLDWLG